MGETQEIFLMENLKYVCIGLAKKFIWSFPEHFTEKPKQTFWPTQYILCPPGGEYC